MSKWPTSEKPIRGDEVNWQMAEQPTRPLRMKMMYHTLKAALLGERHDPYSPQTSALLSALSTHQDYSPDDQTLDERTLKHWHDGSCMLYERHQELILAVCSDAMRWLDGTRIIHPLERHLYVIDGMALELTKEGDERKVKQCHAERAIEIVDAVWSHITRQGKEVVESKELKFQNQLQSVVGSLNANAKIFDAKKIPQGVIEKYSYRDKTSLLSFLMALAEWNGLGDDALSKLLVIDLASVAAAIRVQNYLAEKPFMFSGQGLFGIQSGFASRLLWEPESETRSEWLKAFSPPYGFRSKTELTDILINGAKSYYGQFSAYGVTEDELMEVAGLWVNPDAPDSPVLAITRGCKLLKLSSA